eukprot:Em0008g613a
MATLGKLGEFSSECESLVAYIERVEVYFLANNIGNERKVPVLLSVLGSKTYAVLRDLLAPTKPKDKSFAELVEVLSRHFEPKPIIIAERFRFHRRDQKSGESIAVFLSELRRLAAHCSFGAFLEEALRDRLVCGVTNDTIQRRLLTEADLTLNRAFEIAQGMEAAMGFCEGIKNPGGQPEQTVGMVDDPGEQKIEKMVQGPYRVLCQCCGRRGHQSRNCRQKGLVCFNCGKQGHVARMCSKQKQVPRYQGQKVEQESKGECFVQTDEDEEESVGWLNTVYVLRRSSSSQPITVKLKLNGKETLMELDTGAAVSIIPEAVRKELFPSSVCQPTATSLRTYTGERITVKRILPVKVEYGSQLYDLKVFVVKGEGPSLFGRDWLKHIRLDWHKIQRVTGQEPGNLAQLLKEYNAVFSAELGTIKTFKARLVLKKGALPKFCRARSVPFALRPAVEAELDRLEKLGILEKVSYSNWATPIVPVVKGDGSVRICGDYKVTLNPCLEVDQYPLPKPEELFATLAGGEQFTKMDLSQAYLQLELEEESKRLVTINTHKGLYRFNRLPFGVASAPAIFQKVMESVLLGIPRVVCYLDDILITGSTVAEHLRNVERVLKQLRTFGIQAKKDKCAFQKESFEFLGHVVDKKGLHTSPRKVEAILQAPVPQNKKELRSFLGLVHYYGKFIPKLSSLLSPLNDLLKEDHQWQWCPRCNQAFVAAKEALSRAPVLVHYDPSLPVRVAGDASASGIGAVISHMFPDGSEHPIAYASRTLSKAECNYAQLEKEALSLIFGIKRFHIFLYGRPFTLVTDHKPLLCILGPKQGIPELAAARLQRWALVLAAYNYELEFRPTEGHGNADGLSRLPLPQVAHSDQEINRLNVAQIEALPVSADQVQNNTLRDPILSKVLHYTRNSWPPVVPDELKAYWIRRNELSVECDCLFWGIRVIIPSLLQPKVKAELHNDHPGVVRMKLLARGHVWWPGLDKELEDLVGGCLECQSHKHTPSVAPLHPWIWPTRPWRRIHVDFAGPFLNKMFLVVVDAHSKWPEVIPMSSTTAVKTIEAMRQLFGTYGIPEQVVSDNGPQFVADEFAIFLKQNGVKHIRCAPYHPSSNGIAERFVQTFKTAMKVNKVTPANLSQRLNSFLLSYRNTPHTTTNEAPSTLFLGRKLRSLLDLLRPSVEKKVFDHQTQQKDYRDAHAKFRECMVGEQVLVFDPRNKRWERGLVVERSGPTSYVVQIRDDVLWKRHIDHIKPIAGSTLTNPGSTTSSAPIVEFRPLQSTPNSSTLCEPLLPTPAQEVRPPEVTASYPLSQPTVLPEKPLDQTPRSPQTTMENCTPQPSATVQPASNTQQDHTPQRCYPTRIRRPPERL